MIIVLIGKMGTGKTTIANYLINNYGFKKASFADKVKELAVDLFNMQEKNRSLLIQVAQKMKDIDSDVWVNATLKKIQLFLQYNNNIVIDDCRFKNEYAALQKLNNIIFIKLEISPEEQVKRLKNLYSNYQNHIDCGKDYSENDLNKADCDYFLKDASFKQTYRLLDHIMNLHNLKF